MVDPVPGLLQAILNNIGTKLQLMTEYGHLSKNNLDHCCHCERDVIIK